ncbi:zinc ribbon domain-containing protein [Lysinibacillus mangiferihumi]|nr:zinc ribbon domain-containing protein [Lysinibacillus mangiferihumi]
MFCIHCGEKISEEALFCSKCGTTTNKKEAPILTGKVNRKFKLGVFYSISAYVMGGALIPIFIFIFLTFKFHESIYGILLSMPGVLYVVGYGVAVLLFSHFFATTTMSKILVKITFITYLIGTIVVAINIPFFLFAAVSVDFNTISDMNPIFSDGKKRIVALLMILPVLFVMASYLLIIFLLLKRWFKKEKGITLKKGLQSIFRPKFNKIKFINIVKNLR